MQVRLVLNPFQALLVSPCEVINILAWYANGYGLLWFSFELQNTDAITIRDGNVTESLDAVTKLV